MAAKKRAPKKVEAAPTEENQEFVAPPGFERIEEEASLPTPEGFELLPADGEVLDIPAGFEAVPPPPPAEPLPFAPIPDPLSADDTGQDPGLFERGASRLMGSDVPTTEVETQRMMTTIGTSVAFGLRGGQIGLGVGGPVGGAIGLLGGSALGAYLGAGFPEAALQLSETEIPFTDFSLMPKGTRLDFGLNPVDLQTLRENEALLSVAFDGAFGLVRGGSRVTAQFITGADREAAEAAAKLGVDMQPVMVGDRVIGRGYATVFGRFPWLGGAFLREQSQKSIAQFESIIKGLPSDFHNLVNAPELGKTMLEDGLNIAWGFKRHFKSQYDAVWARADQLGVTVVPNNLLDESAEILNLIANKERLKFLNNGVEPTPKLLKVVEKLIKKRVLPMRGQVPAKRVAGEIELGGVKVTGTAPAGPPITKTQPQSLKAIDSFLETLDGELARLSKPEQKFVSSLLNRLRSAAQKDQVLNVRGESALEIISELKRIDADYSIVKSELLGSTVANKFKSVVKGGLDGPGGKSIKLKKKTNIPIDRLATSLVDLNSPQAMEELSNLVSPDTFRRIAGNVFEDALSKATNKGLLDIDAFAKRLGIDGSNALRREAVKTMIEKSGAPVTMEMLDDIVKVGRSIADFDIPNVSSFIARRGAIGGIRSVIDGAVPGLALMGGGGALAFGNLLGIALFVGGNRLVGKIISNPVNARLLGSVMDKEIGTVVKRSAILNLMVNGLRSMRDDDDRGKTLTEGEFRRLRHITVETLQKVDAHISNAPVQQGAELFGGDLGTDLAGFAEDSLEGAEGFFGGGQ